ncbi:hypothetical protein PVAND_003095 [Polypedilum vanderplanki]|uniref:Gustatory receptor n=1 Tax=Polypedilum vanderplanki TaxID=319348 RepID=A0A9J6BT01_POLVA|nr:hypothetical protein PVAND_003095 [Polypedilum vanderplanki]
MKSISRFLYIAKAFGLMPFPLNYIADEKKKYIRFKFLHRIPTLIMLIFYVICVSSILWKNRTSSEISNTANWIQFIPNSIIFFIVLITADRSRFTIQSVGKMIYDLDNKLHPLTISCKTSQDKTKNISLFAALRKLKIFVKFLEINLLISGILLLIVVVICGSSIAILHYLIGVKPCDYVSKFYWMAFVLAKIGLLTFNFMFALYMMVVLERLIIIRRTVKYITELNVEKSLNTKNSSEIRSLNILTAVIVPSTTISEILDNLYEVVEIIQKICSKMNSYFGKKVIFTVLSAFICLTVQLFYLINNIRNGFQTKLNILASVASCSLIFTHILELWVIFISGHRVKDMWNVLIKRIQGTKRRFASDEIFKAKIDELISIMVLTKVEMRAAGFFNIDLSVITSIASSIATYLVVLLQFKISEDEGNTNSTKGTEPSQYVVGQKLSSALAFSKN